MIEVIRARDLVRTPWKNGGGTTAEVAAWPEGAGLDAFGWRLSMADVATDGAFSVFPGVDRTLLVTEGAGLIVDVAGRPHRLDGRWPYLAFDGEAATHAALIAGPVRDLNVMTRRGSFRHHLTVIGTDHPWSGALRCHTVAIVALASDAVVAIDGSEHRLDRLDCLLVRGAGGMRLAASGPAALVRVYEED
jgi:environmental stress-induced protein Ves